MLTRALNHQWIHLQLTGDSVSTVVGAIQPNKFVDLPELFGVWKVSQKVIRLELLALGP